MEISSINTAVPSEQPTPSKKTQPQESFEGVMSEVGRKTAEKAAEKPQDNANDTQPEAALQMAAAAIPIPEIIADMPEIVSQMPEVIAQTPELIPQMNAPLPVAQVPEAVAQPSEPIAQIPEAPEAIAQAPEAVSQLPQASPQATETQAIPTAEQKQAFTVQTQESPAQAEENAKPTAEVSVQRSFFEAVGEVRRNLNSKTEAQPEAPDASTLQQQVERGEYVSAPTVSSIEEGMDELSPVRQTAGAVIEGIHSGKDEYEIILKPEGLGKITVHLTQDENGMITVSLTAQSRETAELLREGFMALQTQLTPHGAQLDEIKTPQQQKQQDFTDSNSRQEQEQHRDKQHDGQEFILSRDEEEENQ